MLNFQYHPKVEGLQKHFSMVFSNKILFENSNKRKNFLIFSIEGNDSKYYTKNSYKKKLKDLFSKITYFQNKIILF